MSQFFDKSPSADHLAQACEFWDLAPELTFHRHLANFVYFGSKGSEEIVVRLTPPEHRTGDEIVGELAFQTYLISNGFSAAKPILSKQKKLVEEVGPSQNSFFAAVFNRIPGERVAEDFSKTPQFLQAWGKYLGELHNLSEKFGKTHPAKSRSDWKVDSVKRLGETALKFAPEICQKRFAESTNWLESLDKDPSVFGLVHGDLHRGNFFYTNGTFTSFDYDDSCYHWFLYDLSSSLSSVLKAAETEQERTSIIQEFTKGYLSAREISPAWLDRLEGFFQYRLTVVYLWMNAMIRDGRFQDATVESWKEVESWYLVNMERRVLFK